MAEAVEHSCLHATSGPFASVAAQAYPGPITADVSAAHTAHDVVMPTSGAGRAAVSLRVPRAGRYAISRSGAAMLSLVPPAGGPVPSLHGRALTGRECEHLRRVDVYDLAAATTYHLVFEAAGAPNVTVVVEALDPFACEGGGHGGEGSVGAAIKGNVPAHGFPASGSLGFILIDGRYEFFRMPAMGITSIGFVDSRAEKAYGFYRSSEQADGPYSFVLDLKTNRFTPIDIPGTRFAFVRSGNDAGKLVGKLAWDGGTPADPSDDTRKGFVYDVATGWLDPWAHPGATDTGFTGIARDGTITGFTEFGAAGFVLRGGRPEALADPRAQRLFPNAINDAGVIVGFWGEGPNWWEDNHGFVARPVSGGGYSVRRYEQPGRFRSAPTGINNLGAIAGNARIAADDLPVPFRAASADAPAESFPLPPGLGRIEPFVTGINDAGLIYGQAFVLEPPPACGGHGQLAADRCLCDAGYRQDPQDPRNCLAPDAECSGHGHLHGAVCHCDPGFVPDPADPGRCLRP